MLHKGCSSSIGAALAPPTSLEGIVRLYGTVQVSTKTRLIRKGGAKGVILEALVSDPPFPAVNEKLTKPTYIDVRQDIDWQSADARMTSRAAPLNARRHLSGLARGPTTLSRQCPSILICELWRRRRKKKGKTVRQTCNAKVSQHNLQQAQWAIKACPGSISSLDRRARQRLIWGGFRVAPWSS